MAMRRRYPPFWASLAVGITTVRPAPDGHYGASDQRSVSRLRASAGRCMIMRPRCGGCTRRRAGRGWNCCGGGAARNVGAVGESELIGRRREMAYLRGWLMAAVEGEPRL